MPEGDWFCPECQAETAAAAAAEGGSRPAAEAPQSHSAQGGPACARAEAT